MRVKIQGILTSARNQMAKLNEIIFSSLLSLSSPTTTKLDLKQESALLNLPLHTII